MQLITLLSTAIAMAVTATATDSDERPNAVQLNEKANLNLPHARIINRCDYDVHLWSVLKSTGCPTDGMVTLKSGEIYTENLAEPSLKYPDIGVSIKISKTKQCKGNDITQLEYFRKMNGDPQYQFNYLDVSYVDCLGMDCPTRQDGYYLISGSQTGVNVASEDNTVCPSMGCWDAVSCDKISYVLPDDKQTRSCHNDQSLSFYMCGGEAPSGDYSSAPKPSSSAKPSSLAQYSTTKPKPTPKPTPTHASSSTADLKVAAAAITSSSITPSDIPKYTKTQVVYVTAYKYVDAKRHAHDHARRHQPFHA